MDCKFFLLVNLPDSYLKDMHGKFIAISPINKMHPSLIIDKKLKYSDNKNFLNLKSSYVRDPTTIQFLFEVSRSLHDYIDLSTIKDKENNHCANLIFRFIHMVDYGSDGERHLAFLVQCRGVFGSMSEVKETIVHSSNLLVVKATRSGSNYVTFVKSCIACSEVTIPSIPSHLKQLNLYLETAEVALMAGLVSHSDGLVDSALRCLHSVDLLEGLSMNSSPDVSVQIVVDSSCRFAMHKTESSWMVSFKAFSIPFPILKVYHLQCYFKTDFGVKFLPLFRGS
ncbi:hypothetical protein T459_08720 [Capsicum annuum]|uniref:Uncharacterized protein n=1 Tax=Capsicum annuum TaxID=4072 RepID=A0A2G2ZXB9_CAPAN|nr:hypothetical protein T459_08720 [Capsicum annuum]